MKTGFVFHKGNTIKYQIILMQQAQKKPLLIVYPDLSVIVICPPQIDRLLVSVAVRKNVKKIYDKISYFNKVILHPDLYKNGECILYLGRKYSINIKKCTLTKVILTRREIQVYLNNIQNNIQIKKIIQSWYVEKTKSKILEIHEKYESNQLIKSITTHTVIKYKTCKTEKSICFYDKSNDRYIVNACIIKLPIIGLDYIIYHYACHQSITNHSQNFYKMLNAIMPQTLFSKFIIG